MTNSMAVDDETTRAAARHQGEDPTGRDWSPWLDGRARRLKRGRDYAGEPKPLVKRAREAAEALGRTAVASVDSAGRYEYLWVQFVDGEVRAGESCPKCEGTTLEKVQKLFLRCSSCGATLKAAEDWKVSAGEFSPPVQAPSPGGRDPAAEGGPEGDDFAEVIGARVLSADGEEIHEPSIAQDFFVEVSIRFHRSVDKALPRLELLLREGGPAVRLHAPEIVHPPGPGTVEARVRVPSGLLAPRRYRLGVVVFLVPDQAASTEMLVVWSAPLTFRVLKAPAMVTLEEIAELGSALDWEVAERPDASERLRIGPHRPVRHRPIGRFRRASDVYQEHASSPAGGPVRQESRRRQ